MRVEIRLTIDNNGPTSQIKTHTQNSTGNYFKCYTSETHARHVWLQKTADYPRGIESVH